MLRGRGVWGSRVRVSEVEGRNVQVEGRCLDGKQL